MNKIKGSMIAKVISWLLLAVSIVIFTGSCVMVEFMESNGVFSGSYTYKEARAEDFKRWGGTYAIDAVEYMVSGRTIYDKNINNGSFRYGIIKTDTLEGIDLGDKNIYLYENFGDDIKGEIYNIGNNESILYAGEQYVRYRAVDYYVVYYIDEGIIRQNNKNMFDYILNYCKGLVEYGKNDVFVWIDAGYNMIEGLKESIFIFLIGSFILISVSLVFLISAAGHRRKVDEIVLTFLDKIPFDIFCILVIAIELNAISLIEELSWWFRGILSGVFVVLLIVFMIAVMLFSILSVAVRIKKKVLFKNTLINRIGTWVCKLVGLIFRNINILWKAHLIILALSVIEIVAIYISEPRCPEIIAFWLIEKIVLYGIVIYVIIQMKQLQEGSECIAEGNLNHKIDTKKMFWEFKKHGDNLNKISVGMASAVEERLKSERLKTELITNVSHDIKTPLTSIINYVDLLGKTNIEDENAKEYLEVLERQSGRLKKLIEDLMEASKASTGNITVNKEKLEVGVFLTQMMGEYEEKCSGLNLEMIISKPEDAIYINADGRHLWRIVDNLMNNICKYAQSGTRVYVNLEEQSGKAILVFRNISKYQLNISGEELKERFVRGDSSRNTEGNGLGLSIAGSLVELMDGKLGLYVDGDLFKVMLEFPLFGKVEEVKSEETLNYKELSGDTEQENTRNAHESKGEFNKLKNSIGKVIYDKINALSHKRNTNHKKNTGKMSNNLIKRLGISSKDKLVEAELYNASNISDEKQGKALENAEEEKPEEIS